MKQLKEKKKREEKKEKGKRKKGTEKKRDKKRKKKEKSRKKGKEKKRRTEKKENHRASSVVLEGSTRGRLLFHTAPDGGSRKLADKSVTLVVTLPTSNAVVTPTESSRPKWRYRKGLNHGAETNKDSVC